MELMLGGLVEVTGDMARRFGRLWGVSEWTVWRMAKKGRALLAAGAEAVPCPVLVGRPAASGVDVLHATLGVREALVELGPGAGEGRVRAWLAWRGEQVSLRLVRAALRSIKASWRERAQERAERDRVHVEVEHRGALWCLDATHVGRARRLGRKQSCEVLRDAGTRAVAVRPPGPAATAEEVIAWLAERIAEAGHAPLVLATDNGAPYRSEVFRRYLDEQGIVHLVSLPRTPQHNAWAERAMRELKGGEEPLGRGVVASREELAGRVARRVEVLNGGIARRVLGGRTSRAVVAERRPGEVVVDRWKFFGECLAAMDGAALNRRTCRGRRLARRRAILDTMERHELITITRGR